MGLFRRDFEKLEIEREKKEKRKEGLQKLKNENLSGKDIFALVVAMFQLILPFAVIVVVVYFLVIFFLGKVWG